MKSCNADGSTTDTVVDTGAYLLGVDVIFIYAVVESGPPHENGHRRMQYHVYHMSEDRPYIFNEFFGDYLNRLVPIADKEALESIFVDLSEKLDEMSKDYEREITVLLPCTGEKLSESKVEFDNIEEDFQGRDWLTFTCPRCNQKHQSFRYG